MSAPQLKLKKARQSASRHRAIETSADNTIAPLRTKIQDIQIASINVGERMRPLGDIDALAESIRSRGLINPITVTARGVLVSGLHRLAAFKPLGHRIIPATVIDVSSEEAKLREIDENLVRNDLTLLERAEHLSRRKELYERLYPETRKGGDRGNQHTGGKKRQTSNLPFSLASATLTGRSGSTVRRMVRIADELTPETRRQLRGTGLADNQRALLRLCNMAPDFQEEVAAKVATREAVDLPDAVAKVRLARFNAKSCSLPHQAEDYRLLCGDFRKVGFEVASGSVDLILTDAPYEKQYLDIFKPLSLFASRALRDGGSLVVMMGQSYLPQALNDLGAYLQYHWIIATVLGQPRTLIRHRRVMVGYKPMLWFTKGNYRGRAMPDLLRSAGPDKNFHDHGQSESEFTEVIERMTKEGSTILDPFVGGGSVAAATLRQGWKFVGIDIDRKHIETTRRGIEQVAGGAGAV